MSTALTTPVTYWPLSRLTDDQNTAIDRLTCEAHTLLYAKPGAGKTIIALQAAYERLSDLSVSRVLVVAPKKVCESVWAQEAGAWVETAALTVAVATGTEKARRAAVESESHLLVINFECVAWLFKNYHFDTHGCDGLIIDELSKLKDPGGVAFKALRWRGRDFRWRVGMTGTPVAEDYTGLYAQALIVDQGASFGTRKDKFLDAYFYPLDYNGYKWGLKTDGEKALLERLTPLLHAVPDYRESLPAINYHKVLVTLPPAAMTVYKKLKRDTLAEIENQTIVAANAAVLTGKLAQVASGFIIDTHDNDALCTVHDAKLAALKNLLRELKYPRVLIAYWYQHDRDILQQTLGYPVLTEQKKAREMQVIVDRWNRQDLPGLLIHPRSAGHGLNLAAGGHTVIWYGPQWSRDLWEQTNARLWRQGQKEVVNVYTLIAHDTIDEVIEARVEDKGEHEAALMRHLFRS